MGLKMIDVSSFSCLQEAARFGPPTVSVVKQIIRGLSREVTALTGRGTVYTVILKSDSGRRT